MSAQEELLRLWIHENKRVFEDRMTTREDHDWFLTLMQGQLSKHFGMEWKDVVQNDRLIYGDYMIPGADPRVSFIPHVQLLQKNVSILSTVALGVADIRRSS